MSHLWEQKHAYYCSPEYQATKFRSWAEFMGSFGDIDKDCNLLFRWDWQGIEDVVYEPGQDVNYRDGVLRLFYVVQRKGYVIEAKVEVCQADEPAVQEYLDKGLNYLLEKVWGFDGVERVE